jgi:hypothetical protein
MKQFIRIALLIVTAFWAARVGASGYYGPDQYLDRGGANVDASPEFYWDLETKRLSRAFHPPEKLVETGDGQKEAENIDSAARNATKSEATAGVDVKDYAAALKEGRIKPPDPQKASQQHEAARKFIEETDAKTTGPLPEEFPSEFADYHRGAFAYRRGQEHWSEARTAWEGLLKRPEQERHDRTVWAAFMLGKMALKAGDFGAAATWFERTRELARAGFADSMGMAADSYGWEGRSEWKQNHPAKAAEFFLTQLALGDETAVISLKALVPDRDPIEGMLNYGPESEEISKWSEQQKRENEARARVGLKTAARDPWLRRLVTAHILATASTHDLFSEDSGIKPVNRCARWLATIREEKLGAVDDAEYLGWVAYNNGDYKDAAHWLELAKADAPAACWLRAKLQRRAGKLNDAAQSMAKAWEGVHRKGVYTGWAGSTGAAEGEYGSGGEGPSWTFDQSASGDLGALRLSRGDFVQAFDTFRKGGLWNDAAFVGERVLTTNELKKYVDEQGAGESPDEKGDIGKLRYLLGRRLVREDRYEEAAQYLRPPYNKILQKYVSALQEGANEKLPKEQRARAWFTAAWLARYDGMELMGTEGAPDVFVEGGSFELADLAKQRRTGTYQTVRYDSKGEAKTITSPIVLKPTKEELQRLAQNKISPDLRFHYRVIAGELAIRAAKFLPDNTEELADVVNAAGLWVKDRDEKIANRYFQILDQRGAKTEIGRAARARHWFVDETGPWSAAQQQAYEAMRKELGLETNN